MKHRQEVRLPKISADAIATNLKRGLGRDKALKIAEGLAKELHGIGTEDVNTDFFKMKDVRKNERVWTQVRNILQNQKGYTVIELLALISILATLCLGAFGVYALCHFVAKFW